MNKKKKISKNDKIIDAQKDLIEKYNINVKSQNDLIKVLRDELCNIREQNEFLNMKLKNMRESFSMIIKEYVPPEDIIGTFIDSLTIDNEAFTIVEKINEVIGNGFEGELGFTLQNGMDLSLQVESEKDDQ